jgi:hypothetical protein
MLTQEIILTRLAIIKQLYKVGLEQSKQAESMAAFSILSFHDSVEMFLKLLAEQKGINSENFRFMEYWDKIQGMTLAEPMRALNTRRKNIKHNGHLPSKGDIEISKVNTTDFFEQNTIKQFEIEFKDISLLELIKFEDAKKYLYEAQEALNNSEFNKSVEHAAIGFRILIYHFELKKTYFTDSSPFTFRKKLKKFSPKEFGMENRKLVQYFDDLKDIIENLEFITKILSFGIDFKRFAKFQLLSPIVIAFGEGMYETRKNEEKKWTRENCQYCIDFVVDTALKLQEFDFDIEEIEENPFI